MDFDFLPNNCTFLPGDDALRQALSPDGVLYLIMNRPEVLNAFNGKQIGNITHALENAAENELVRVVVLTGAGDNFCAGGDIQHMKAIGKKNQEENKEDALKMALLMNTLHEFPKPTIARVNGNAFGGGVGLLCCCDMAFGSVETKICLSEVKIGMVPATIGPYVMRAVGLRYAHRLMLSAEVMQGQAAVDCHLLSGIFSKKEMNEQINALAKKISRHAPQALQATKALLLNLAYQPIEEGLIDYTADVIANARESEEGKEGLSAFLEKRRPSF